MEIIVDRALEDPQFFDNFLDDDPNVTFTPKIQKKIEVNIIDRKKGKIRFYPDEWQD